GPDNKPGNPDLSKRGRPSHHGRADGRHPELQVHESWRSAGNVALSGSRRQFSVADRHGADEPTRIYLRGRADAEPDHSATDDRLPALAHFRGRCASAGSLDLAEKSSATKKPGGGLCRLRVRSASYARAMPRMRRRACRYVRRPGKFPEMQRRLGPRGTDLIDPC
ncbi:MAG: hypothetical protein JWN51_3113, partial [Phycisphaerales bacterium]|nr:hypothetical protein [Phycisphaerales bacterium]